MATFDPNFYKNAVDEYTKKVKSDTNMQKQQADATRQNSLQQAYIQRLQNQNTLANNLSQQGIRGGVSETANLNLMNTYNANRNAANATYADQARNIDTSANDNIFNYTQQMKTAEAEYQQNQDIRQEEQIMNYYNSRYSKYYSVKDLKKLLAKASNTLDKTAINNRIAYLIAHKRGY